MKRADGFNRIELTLLIVVVALLGLLSVPAFKAVQLHSMQSKGVRSCEQIIAALKHFAKDMQSQYPDTVHDPKSGNIAFSSNDAFRLLIQEQIVKDERIFGCPNGYNPDGNIGSPPDFKMALLPGENHWAMTGGQTDTSPGSMPIVFENPASGNWPPIWNANINSKRVGRTWPGGQIIIGRNDGSVGVEKLSGEKGMVSPKQERGMDLFMRASAGVPQRVLTVVTNEPQGCIGPYPFRPLGAPGGLPPSPLGNP